MPDRPAPTWTKATSAVSRFAPSAGEDTSLSNFFFFVFVFVFPFALHVEKPYLLHMYLPPRVLLHTEGLERDVKKARGAGKGKESKGWCNCRLKSEHPGYGFMSMSCGAVRCGTRQQSQSPAEGRRLPKL